MSLQNNLLSVFQNTCLVEKLYAKTKFELIIVKGEADSEIIQIATFTSILHSILFYLFLSRVLLVKKL